MAELAEQALALDWVNPGAYMLRSQVDLLRHQNERDIDDSERAVTRPQPGHRLLVSGRHIPIIGPTRKSDCSSTKGNAAGPAQCRLLRGHFRRCRGVGW
jgi:hypothetical protein